MELNDYQQQAGETAIYPNRYKLVYPVLGLVGEAGEVAEKMKKVARDENGKVSDDKAMEMLKEVGDVLWYVAAVCRDLGYTLEDAAQLNLKKLRSRQERDKLQGSGDNR